VEIKVVNAHFLQILSIFYINGYKYNIMILLRRTRGKGFDKHSYILC